jgi:hypothetical protein
VSAEYIQFCCLASSPYAVVYVYSTTAWLFVVSGGLGQTKLAKVALALYRTVPVTRRTLIRTSAEISISVSVLYGPGRVASEVRASYQFHIILDFSNLTSRACYPILHSYLLSHYTVSSSFLGNSSQPDAL